jgi:molybdenum cofactor biosynthesis enzyme MoaA
MNDNGTYCSEAWRTVHYSDKGILGPCCTFRGGRDDTLNSIDDYLESKWLADVRQKMLMGERIPGCNNCYKKEDKGFRSQRQQGNEQYGFVTDTDIKTLYLSFGNICNKTCNICRPGRSHLIAKQYRELKETLWYTTNMGSSFNESSLTKDYTLKFLEKLENYVSGLRQASTIHLDGGEPFIASHCTDILEYMVTNGIIDKTIKATTNGSVTPYQIELLENFKNVHLGISIDGIYDLYECVRSPHNWDWWNLQHDLIRQTNFKRIYLTVLNVFNLHQLPEIVKYFVDNRQKSENSIFYISTINNQEYLDIDIVPDHVKTDTVNNLKKLLSMNILLPSEEQNISNIINYINITDRDSNKLPVFHSFIDNMSKVKKLNYQNYIPWDLYE